MSNMNAKGYGESPTTRKTPVIRLHDDDPTADWTVPGVYQVNAGLYRIPLPLPHDSLKAVNVYAVRDGDGLVLVDSGWALTQARDLLEQAVKTLDCALPEIRRFLVTHVHRDHYTMAVTLRREFGLRVSLGRGKPARFASRAKRSRSAACSARSSRGAEDQARELERRRWSTTSASGPTPTTGSTPPARSSSAPRPGRCTQLLAIPAGTSCSWTPPGT